MLNERSDREKHKHCISSLICGILKKKYNTNSEKQRLIRFES